MVLYTYNPNPNGFVRIARKLYHPIGFSKGYNFILFFIFAGAMFGFCLARLEYFSVDGLFKKGAAPGEFFYYQRSYYKIGISLHLYTIIPAGMLACSQFVPVIRHKCLIVHRISGYLALLLLLCGVTGALMICRYSFGGTLATQACNTPFPFASFPEGVGALAISTVFSAFLAYYNIKRLQIDQHRAWMLRTWFYAGAIITTRIIMILSALIISMIGNYYISMPCKQIGYIGGNANAYPACRTNPSGQTAVLADFNNPSRLEQLAASMQTSFGMAGWLALWLHAIGVEIYLRLTPAEGERLRKVSWERQVERGLSHPGSSGSTIDRFGDAETWTPPAATNGDEQKKVVDDSDSI